MKKLNKLFYNLLGPTLCPTGKAHKSPFLRRISSVYGGVLQIEEKTFMVHLNEV